MKRPEMAAIGRIAGRTALRNWKRTGLVVALIAIPVAAAQIASGMFAASRIAPEEYATQQLGSAGALIQAYAPTPDSAEWVEGQLADLVPGAATHSYRNVYGSIPDVTDYVEITDLDITHPLAQGKLGLVSGAVPTRSGEVAISDGVAAATNAEIGDDVSLAIDGGQTESFTVVGTFRDALYRNRDIVILSVVDMDAVFATTVNTLEFAVRDISWLVDGGDTEALVSDVRGRWEEARSSFRPEPALPRPAILEFLDADLYASLSADQIEELVAYAELRSEAILEAETAIYSEAFRLLGGSPPTYPEIGASAPSDYLGWESGADQVLQAPAVIGTVIAALMLAEVALVAGAAYATGIRRRLRELGLLSVNGATVQHLRFIVVGEGMVAGLVGAGIGTAIAIAALQFGRPVLQNFVDRYITGDLVGPFELVPPALVGVAAATIAAWVPARAAARVPAVTALEGRMPLARPHRWTVPLAAGLVGFGAFLLVVAKTALGSSGAFQAGLGVAVMIAGFALMTGPIVAWVGMRADRFPAVTRLVIRDSARQRTRAATAIAATMVVLVAPVAAAAALQTDEASQRIYGLDENPSHVVVAAGSGYDFPPDADADPRDVAAVASLLPSATQTDFSVYTVTGQIGTTPVDPPILPESVALADRAFLDALGVPDMGTELASGRAVVLGVERGRVDVVIAGTTVEGVQVPAHVMKQQFPRILVSAEMANDLGLGDPHQATLFVNDRPLNDRDREVIHRATPAARPGYAPAISSSEWMLIGSGATLLVVLLIIALVTALAATESDHDLRTMVAVGAPPRIRRTFLGIQTVYYTSFAALLAVPLTMVLLNVASSENWNQAGPFGVFEGGTVVTPWAMIGAVVVAIPLAVGAITAMTVRSAPTEPPRRIG